MVTISKTKNSSKQKSQNKLNFELCLAFDKSSGAGFKTLKVEEAHTILKLYKANNDLAFKKSDELLDSVVDYFDTLVKLGIVVATNPENISLTSWADIGSGYEHLAEDGEYSLSLNPTTSVLLLERVTDN